MARPARLAVPARRLETQPPARMVDSVSSEGELLKEIDLRELGMGAPLMVFDLNLGTQVDLLTRLDPGRDYALVCDSDLSVPGATQCFKSKSCRLPAGRSLAPLDPQRRL